MSDLVQGLWGFCNTLRHDGIDYGDIPRAVDHGTWCSRSPTERAVTARESRLCSGVDVAEDAALLAEDAERLGVMIGEADAGLHAQRRPRAVLLSLPAAALVVLLFAGKRGKIDAALVGRLQEEQM